MTVIEKSLSIFSIDKSMLSLKEIYTRVEFNPSTTYRILQTLADYGYVVRTVDKNYCIGTQVFIFKNVNHLIQIRAIVDGIRDACCDEMASFFY